ncbi:MAG TPA: hypothetical protein VE078_06270, partial [Thermoanaerobaculia bacterium]|nr:hypothetical protein [Thermoanaerobaculia bacterium]
GEHTITLTVSDSEGLSASDEIHIGIEPPALDYYTVVPCRVLDTRSGAPLASMSAREFPVGDLCGVPPSAPAVSVNITAISPTGTGYMTLWPAGIPRPNTSAISFSAGRTRASNLILPLAYDGSGLAAVEAVVAGSGSVHMAVDITGYFE